MTSELPPHRPFYRLATYLQERYGTRVHKVSLHGGFTCPNRDGTVARGGCAFCSGVALHPVGYEPGQSIHDQLDSGKAYIRKRHGTRHFIAYFQDYSATYAGTQDLAELYRPALDDPDVVAIAISTRPDCLPIETLDLLQRMSGAKDLWVELGLQIADDPLLAAVNRGHTVADFENAVMELSDRGLRACAHVIIGLPGATPTVEARTAKLIAELGVWGVKLHAFHVLKGTAMARRYQEGTIAPLTLDEHASRVVSFVERLPCSCVIHRVTAESPRRLTLAPSWTANKLAAYDRVVAEFARRNTWQGRLG